MARSASFLAISGISLFAVSATFVGFVGACGQTLEHVPGGSDAEIDASDTGAASPDAEIADAPQNPGTEAGCLHGPFEIEPVAELNDVGDNIGARLGLGDSTIYFARKLGTSTPSRIYRAQRLAASDPFGAPSLIMAASDLELGKPMVAGPGDRHLYYHRTLLPSSHEIVIAELQNDGRYADQRALSYHLNTGAVFDPYVTSDETELYFSAKDIRTALFVAKSDGSGSFLPGTKVTPSDKRYQAAPVVSADGLTLYFSTADVDEPADTSVWEATRKDKSQPFTSAREIAELNAPGKRDEPSFVTHDGCTLYLTSNRDGPPRIYRSRRR